jgi:hypothetical protein
MRLMMMQESPATGTRAHGHRPGRKGVHPVSLNHQNDLFASFFFSSHNRMGIMIMMMKCYFNYPNEQSDDRALH